jgi:intracellular septation protein A
MAQSFHRSTDGLFDIFIAVLNLYFVYYQSNQVWFYFKDGDMALFMIFYCCSAISAKYPYMPKDEDDKFTAVTSADIGSHKCE